MSLPLKDIVSALTNEIAIAAIRTDVNRSHWQDIYDDDEILREYTPSKVRISELKISIPVAINEIPKGKIVNPNLTSKQVIDLLPFKMSVEEKKKYSRSIKEILLEKRLHLLSKNVSEEVIKAITSVTPNIKIEDINITHLDKLKRDYIAQPNMDREVTFIYSAKELEKISSEHIVRIELSIDVD